MAGEEQAGLGWLDARLATGNALIVQGPTGTLLEQKNLTRRPHEVMNNQPAREVVANAHTAYLDAGADVLVAYTFGAQPERVEDPFIPPAEHSRARQTIHVAAGLAIGAAVPYRYEGQGVTVAGSAGPIGDCYDPKKHFFESSELYAAQKRHIGSLSAAGVDLVLAETIPSLREAWAIYEAAVVAAVPWAISFYYEEVRGELRLPGGGPTLGEAVALFASLEHTPRFIASNCVPLETAVDAVSLMRRAASPVPVGILPNGIGVPTDADVATWGPRVGANREEFTKQMGQAITAGALLLGGCCCTTPEDTAALRQIV